MIENRWRFSLSRRRALASFAGMFAASPLLKAQIDPHSLIGHKRIPRIDELVDAFDFEALCYRNMTLEPYDYMAHGDGSEWNLRRNRQAFDWVDIVQGKAVDPASVDMSSVILGVPMKFPIFTAPSSGQGALHPDGEIGMYRGATAANALAAFASGTTVPHQKIAPAATGPRWQQFYPIPDLGASAKQLQMFQDLGAKAIIITVDQQASVYERDLHDRHLGGVVQTGPRRRARRRRRKRCGGCGSGGARIGWADSNNRYRRAWHREVPVGHEVSRVESAALVQLGLHRRSPQVHQGAGHPQGHRHGGRRRNLRQGRRRRHHRVEPRRPLDGLRSVDARSASGDRGGGEQEIPVLIDSGFRRGSDVFKALALGADAVALGRAARGASARTARRACSGCSRSCRPSSCTPPRTPAARH